MVPRVGWVLLLPKVLLRCYQLMFLFAVPPTQRVLKTSSLDSLTPRQKLPFFFTIFKSHDILNPVISIMSHDHLMLTEPEMITLAVLWELSLQLSCGEEGTASREKRKERRKADSRAMPVSLWEQDSGNRGCLRVLKEKEITGHSRRKWSAIPHRLRHKDAVPDAQPCFKRITMDGALGEGKQRGGGDSPSSVNPNLGRVVLRGTNSFLQCQTLQRKFKETSRVQAWQR